MNRTQSVTIPFRGGIISPGQLQVLMELAAQAKITHVKFGLRQQMLLDVPVTACKTFMAGCAKNNIPCELTKNALPNICSSYAGAGIFIQDTWLTEGMYKDVFNLFDYEPRLKINVCDQKQTFVPFFTGHINWIAASQLHYWFLYIRFPQTNTLYCWPEEIYTNDIGQVSRAVEEMLEQAGHEQPDGRQLYAAIKKRLHYTARPLQGELQLPAFHLPYYEGFNRYGKDYWLGIYRRDELFAVSFLKDVCAICLATKIGQLYATTWKSIIIKNIEPPHRGLWDRVLGKYRINVRHAANELNWLVEDANEDALVLKRHIIRYFDKEDVRTYGLCFTVQLKNATGSFGSVIIRKKETGTAQRLKMYDRFDIWHTRLFNPNSTDFVLFRENVQKEHLGPYLVSLSKLFYETAAEEDMPYTAQEPEPVHDAAQQKLVHQCMDCYTIYDAEVGDAAQQIPAGTAFEQLPAGYCCPLCEAPLDRFAVCLHTRVNA